MYDGYDCKQQRRNKMYWQAIDRRVGVRPKPFVSEPENKNLGG